MRKYNIGASLVFIIVGAFVILQCGQWEDYVRGTLGPGFWPKILAIFLVGISLIMLISNFLTKTKENEEPVIDFKSPAFRQIFILFFVLTIFGIALQWLGFFISTIVFVIAVMFVMGVRNWRTMAITAFAIAFSIYLFFAQLLNLYLPTGKIFQ